MESSGYTLDLYCDSAKHGDLPYQIKDGETFIGETGGYCRKIARKRGWVFNKDGTRICPFCSGKMTVENGLREVYGREADLSDLINMGVQK